MYPQKFVRLISTANFFFFRSRPSVPLLSRRDGRGNLPRHTRAGGRVHALTPFVLTCEKERGGDVLDNGGLII